MSAPLREGRLQRIRGPTSNRPPCDLSPSTSCFARQGPPERNMAKKQKTLAPKGRTLRSQLWFDNPENPGMTALYLERYLNYGLTSAELRSGKPIIGIAQTGSDLSPCNRHHLEL